jgi:hypothetical protein
LRNICPCKIRRPEEKLMKKILLSLGLAMALVIGVVGMSAFEAHVVNVTARIENALQVRPDKLTFGTTFPEEVLLRDVNVGLSTSFLNETDVDAVKYMIRQKPKCMKETDNGPDFKTVTENDKGEFICPDGYDIMPLLCPYLSKHPDNTPLVGDTDKGNDESLDAFHGPLTGWDMAETKKWEVDGMLSKSQEDTADLWTIDLHVPCFAGQCAQDNVIPEAYQADPANEHKLFGCDLWYEVTGIGRPQAN